MASFEFEKRNNLRQHHASSKQAETRPERELSYAKKAESHKEDAQHIMNDLLESLSENLGKEVLLCDLPMEFGELGENVLRRFQVVMKDRDEGNLIVDFGHFYADSKALELQVKSKH